MTKWNIACVVVTYNRKELLKRCLDAVNSQVLKPSTVFIVDNASTDGTQDSVKEWGYYECIHNGINYRYVLNSKNEGGAGGFYLGMKTAYDEGGYDALWVMDDDGIPDKKCLRELSVYLGKWDFISPLVVSLDNPDVLSFYDKRRKEFESQADNGIVIGASNPFNGVLFSKSLVKKVGFPKKEMFIWGDETNYRLRATNSGFIPVTVISAVHLHPKDRQIKIKAPLVKKVIAISDVDWKLYYYLRNMTYNTLYVDARNKLIKVPQLLYVMFAYIYHYTFKGPRRMNSIVSRAFKAGFRKDFSPFKREL